MASEEKNGIAKSPRKNALLNYFQESYGELRKVTWPTRNQAVKLTFLVLGFCLISAVFIGTLDFVFNYGHQYLLSIAPEAPISDTVNTPAKTNSTQQVLTQQAPFNGNAVVTDQNGKEIPVKIETVPAGTSQQTK